MCYAIKTEEMYIQMAKKNEHIAEIVIILCSMIWGLRFVVTKQTLLSCSKEIVNAYRYVFAVIGFLIVYRGDLKIKSKNIFYGIFTGVIVVCFMWFQTKGLENVTASKASFLTSTHLVMIPVFQWIFFRIKPKNLQLAAAILCFIGVGVISIESGFSIQKGDIYLIICAVFDAFWIISMNVIGKNKNVHIPSIIFFQSAACACIFSCFALVHHSYRIKWDLNIFFCFIYLSLIAIVLTNIIFAKAMGLVSPVKGAVLLTTESLFATIGGVAFMGEQIKNKDIIGAIIIFCACLCTIQWKGVSKNEKD